VGSDQDNNGRFKKGAHWRPKKEHWGKEWLFNEYHNKQMSTSEIAKQVGCQEANILYWMRKHGIKRRTINEARKIKKWGSAGKQNGMYGRCGSKNPRWIDGSSTLRQTMYARSFWKELAKAVYERDGYKCLRCGATHTVKNKLHAHHVKKWAGNPESRFELKNIVTICQSCHNFIHSKENTKNEFLS
jgi:5-methylcytosine-specific restriction enzyme A